MPWTHTRVVPGNLIQQHGGRFVDAPRDNIPAQFASVVDALQCAVEIQRVLRAMNAVVPGMKRYTDTGI